MRWDEEVKNNGWRTRFAFIPIKIGITTWIWLERYSFRRLSKDHLHLGLVPLTELNVPVYPDNGFNGAINPMPFFNNFYAQDAQQVLTIYQKIAAILKQIVGMSTAPKQAPITS